VALALLACWVLTPACSSERPRESRRAVKALVDAKDEQTQRLTRAVVAFGRYALPDIEQEFQEAPRRGRLLLLRAIERIGDPDALPFLDHVARWDDEPRVRHKAARVAATLRRVKGGSR
jgi:hypothetical protein